MIGKHIGWVFATARDALARGLIRLHVTPNTLTMIGALLTIGAGVCFALNIKTGCWEWSLSAAGFLFGSFACDMLDGTVARFAGSGTKFGALLDSTMDRISDFAIWAGLGFGFIWREPANYTFAGLCALGFLEAVMISYVKARAEDIIEDCSVGYWQRPERCAATIIAAFACNLPAYVVELSLLPIFTLLRRVLHARAVMAGHAPITSARRGTWRHKIQPWLYPRASWPYDIMTGAYIAWLIWGPVDPSRWDILRWWLG
ncbi:MAG: CDP-alcohol phosphatidyltransferase family protein [Phycisphaerae bacterium]|nr:CDP-alcohol phosphatidyltransferase family protein [Phycisphaerae bacterium]